jgi:Fur family transcriptional regulator, peroxide stress response regulator
MESLINKYKKLGIKLTPQRLAILDYMEGNTKHPSAEEIFSAVAKRYPTMSFATVYNTLETLTSRGKLTKLTIDPDKRRFDPDTSPHHHLICIKCSSIQDVRVNYRLTLPEGERAGFEITGNHIEFYGICRSCNQE